MSPGAPFTRIRTNICTEKNFHNSTLRLHGTGEFLSPVYAGPDKFLHEQTLARLQLTFTRDRRNWTNFWTAKYVSFGPSFFWSQTSTQKFVQFRRSRVKAEWNRARFCSFKICPHPCKRDLSVQVWDLKPCTLSGLTVQKFVQFRRSRVNARWNRASFCPGKYLSGSL